ncbi:MAG TPA: hypothetical protein VF584_07640 [Longimicrobium sp.]|jgi:hypothetical protein
MTETHLPACLSAGVLRRCIHLAFLFFLLALPSTAAGQPTRGRAPAAPPAGDPCAVLNSGGTVFDTRECAELASTGMVVRPAAWTILAGRSYLWKVVTGVATGTDTSGRTPAGRARVAVSGTYADGVGMPTLSARGGMPVALVRASDRSVVARAVTAADGSFRIAVPADASGELRLVGFPWVGAPAPEYTVVCNGAGQCFDYCTLPSMPATLEPMCVEDPGIGLLVVGAPVGPTQGPAGAIAGEYAVAIAAADLPASTPGDVRSNVVGSWRLSFRPQGDVTVGLNGREVVRSAFEVRGNTILFPATDSGQYACHRPATYTWSRTGRELTLKAVADDCPGRVAVLTTHPLVTQ